MTPRTAALAIALLWQVACGSDAFKPRDVIVIVMDTTRADHLGVYGYSRDVSPRLDAFANDAEVYRNAWSPSSWTLPAHASLLTGRYPTAHGAHMRPDRDPDSLGKNPAYLSDQAITLAEMLKERDFHTAAYAGAGWLAPEFGLLQGYTVQDAQNLRDIQAQELTDRASAWIDTVPEGEPLHLLVNYFDPHGPYDPPEGYDTFPAAKKKIEKPILPTEVGKLTPEEIVERLSEIRHIVVDRYDGEIMYMDNHIGRLLDKLRAVGRYDDALIVIVADHGEGFGEKGALGHGAWLYEPLIRIPFIIHRPGGRNGGTQVDHLVSLVDVLNIVAEETGLELPPHLDGLPVGARALVLAEEVPSALFKKQRSSLDRDQLAGIRWPLKLIVNIPGPTELYRLDRDPGEKENLADGQAEIELRGLVASAFAALEVAPIPMATRPMSPESRERLKAQGYLE